MRNDVAWRSFLSLLITGLLILASVEGRSSRRRRRQIAPIFNSFGQGAVNSNSNPASAFLTQPLQGLNRLIASLGVNSALRNQAVPQVPQPNVPKITFPLSNSGLDFNNIGRGKEVDLEGIASGGIEGVAAIPVPAFPDPQDPPVIPGVNTIPGLNMFNYVVGQLIPQAVPSANSLLGGTISRLFPQEDTKDLAKKIFKNLHPPVAKVETERMMGRWFQVINSPHVIREACTISHFGALTNNTYSATFTILKFFREGNPNGPPRFALGYGFSSGEDGQFVIHNSNSPDSEPFWVIKTGPLDSFNQYDYAVISNWVKFPVFVIARDPERFKRLHMRAVLEYLESNGYINVLTKALNMIAPVDYSQCQYTPTFSGAGGS